MKKISIIGVGNLGSAIAQSIIEHSPEVELCLCEQNLDRLSSFDGVEKVSDLDQATDGKDIVILAVKPQTFSEIADSLKISDNTILLSVMAGMSVEKIRSFTGCQKVVRTMPNLPLIVGEGVIGYYFGFAPQDEEKQFIESLLNNLGTTICLDAEKKIDAITALSASGPAYFYLLAQVIEEIGMKMGFSQEDAQKIAQGTFTGSALLLKQRPSPSQDFIDRVTSKGGTTEAALKSFEESGYRDIVEKALNAALDRCSELNQ